ncbi:hypothetical protein KKB10_03950 [Patescibacteria group bacterium]|nr:hypothetical protein [Patescibacteria group bacterium]MBU1075591.1 hypothetical protein [Patescibacteria group bacterium]MBU1951927.1 hypothetical protein [Patescibacteria group bacterium]
MPNMQPTQNTAREGSREQAQKGLISIIRVFDRNFIRNVVDLGSSPFAMLCHPLFAKLDGGEYTSYLLISTSIPQARRDCFIRIVLRAAVDYPPKQAMSPRVNLLRIVHAGNTTFYESVVGNCGYLVYFQTSELAQLEQDIQLEFSTLALLYDIRIDELTFDSDFEEQAIAAIEAAMPRTDTDLSWSGADPHER